MEAVLVQKGLWDLIDIMVDEKGKDAEAIAAAKKNIKENQDVMKMNEA